MIVAEVLERAVRLSLDLLDIWDLGREHFEFVQPSFQGSKALEYLV